MQRLQIRDRDQFFEVDVRTALPFAALGDHRAEALIQAAMLMSIATLLEGGEWPSLALRMLRDFMAEMQRAIEAESDSG